MIEFISMSCDKEFAVYIESNTDYDIIDIFQFIILILHRFFGTLLIEIVFFVISSLNHTHSMVGGIIFASLIFIFICIESIFIIRKKGPDELSWFDFSAFLYFGLSMAFIALMFERIHEKYNVEKAIFGINMDIFIMGLCIFLLFASFVVFRVIFFSEPNMMILCKIFTNSGQTNIYNSSESDFMIAPDGYICNNLPDGKYFLYYSAFRNFTLVKCDLDISDLKRNSKKKDKYNDILGALCFVFTLEIKHNKICKQLIYEYIDDSIGFKELDKIKLFISDSRGKILYKDVFNGFKI